MGWSLDNVFNGARVTNTDKENVSPAMNLSFTPLYSY